MDVIARLVAHDEIRLLASRYAVAVDSRDLDDLVELFIPDVQVGRDRSGRSALRDDFEASLSAVGVTILNMGTHAIDLLDHDHATGTVYCTGEIQVGDAWIRQAILYRDTYERRDGTWLFVRRLHELWYGAALEPNPLEQEPARWPASATGRGTVPESWPSWARFWHAHQANDSR
jgi:SnoaL-like domain